MPFRVRSLLLWAASCSLLGAFAAAVPAHATSISRDVISSEVRRNIPAIRRCYESALMRHPDIRGDVTLQFTVASSGQVVSAFVRATTITDTGMLDCLVARVRRWRFPPNTLGDVTVTYPFRFAPGHRASINGIPPLPWASVESRPGPPRASE